jgi:hypothetical protein
VDADEESARVEDFCARKAARIINFSNKRRDAGLTHEVSADNGPVLDSVGVQVRQVFPQLVRIRCVQHCADAKLGGVCAFGRPHQDHYVMHTVVRLQKVLETRQVGTPACVKLGQFWQLHVEHGRLNLRWLDVKPNINKQES